MVGVAACAAKVTSHEPTSIGDSLRLGRDIHIVGAHIEEPLDLVDLLTAVPINTRSGFLHVRSNLYFQDCTFDVPIATARRSADGGEVATQFYGSVAFINCKFKEEADFRSAVFHGAVDFSNSTFAKGSNFQDIICMQRATFNGAFWQGEAKFQQAKFYHAASFMDARASGHVMCQGAAFYAESNFSLTHFADYVDFSLVSFYGDYLGNYAKWTGRTTFSNCTWHEDASIVDGAFGSLSLKGSRCEGNLTIRGEKVTNTYEPYTVAE